MIQIIKAVCISGGIVGFLVVSYFLLVNVSSCSRRKQRNGDERDPK